MSDSRGAAVGALLVAMTSVQAGAALATTMFPAVGPAGAATLRLFLASLILGAAWRPWRARLSGREAGDVTAYGLTLAGMNLLIYQAMARLPLGIAMALEFTGPLTLALVTSRRPTDFAWVVLAGVGLSLLFPVSGLNDSLDPTGVAFALAAGACWAAYIVTGQRVGRSLPAGQATALGMTVGAVVALPVGMTVAGPSLLAMEMLPAAFGVALLSSVIPYTLEMVALKRLPATTFGVLMSLEPGLGAAAGYAFLGDRLAPLQWAAVGCIVLAAAGSSATARDSRPGVESLG